MGTAVIGVTILGATGTIGHNTLDVIARHPNRYKVVALSANTQVERLYRQCLEFRPEFAVMADVQSAEELASKLASRLPDTEVLAGIEGLEHIASLPQVDQVMAAIVGAVGLRPTMAAARSGKRILLANKEALVMGGRLFMDEVRRGGAELLPIDSEHNAIFQSLPSDYSRGIESCGVRHILLTASGGPFRDYPVEKLSGVTPEQAIAHPTWSMGKKISVDSATMMNKGLEIIEACWLFDIEPERVQVVLHPQSVIHSLVQYIDGSVLAQLGNPDMRTPIAHAMAWPERIESGVDDIDLFEVARLDFTPPDYERFPALRLATESLAGDEGMTVVLNAANELAVAAFLDRRIPFTDITEVIEDSLSRTTTHAIGGFDDILAIDSAARQEAERAIAQRVGRVLG